MLPEDVKRPREAHSHVIVSNRANCQRAQPLYFPLTKIYSRPLLRPLCLALRLAHQEQPLSRQRAAPRPQNPFVSDYLDLEELPSIL